MSQTPHVSPFSVAGVLTWTRNFAENPMYFGTFRKKTQIWVKLQGVFCKMSKNTGGVSTKLATENGLTCGVCDLRAPKIQLCDQKNPVFQLCDLSAHSGRVV